MTLMFRVFLILSAFSIWGELSGIRKALETIARKGGAE